MAHPVYQYLQKHGYDSPEQALLAMIETVEKADAIITEYTERADKLVAAHDESISELKSQLEQSQATIDMLQQRIADYDRAMAPETIPPPTEPEHGKHELTESEGTKE